MKIKEEINEENPYIPVGATESVELIHSPLSSITIDSLSIIFINYVSIHGNQQCCCILL